ncbi:MAG TPA: hypothetical protein VD931_12655 [Baekduia sp.]|nr:hypothetical protein [Baekduia sp.]
MPHIMELSGGAWIFLAVVVGWSLFTLISLYTRTGSAINPRPWNNAAIGQSGARRAPGLAGDHEAARNVSRGTR